MKYRIVLAYILLLAAVFSPYTWNLSTLEFSNNKVAALQTQYSLNSSLTIEWLTDNSGQTIIGYKIWGDGESGTPELLEETYIFSEWTLAELAQKCAEQSVHYIAPLMLFIENTADGTFYDISAKETVPGFLFEEIRAQKRDSMSSFHEHEIPHQGLPITSQSLPTTSDTYYVYQTQNYYAEFIVMPNVHAEPLPSASASLTADETYAYKLVDPIDRQQYSLVYVP